MFPASSTNFVPSTERAGQEVPASGASVAVAVGTGVAVGTSVAVAVGAGVAVGTGVAVAVGLVGSTVDVTVGVGVVSATTSAVDVTSGINVCMSSSPLLQPQPTISITTAQSIPNKPLYSFILFF